jgi:hypothetical protein
MNTRIREIIAVATIQMCGVLAVVFYGAGRGWIDEGHGLHPMLAGAGILFCLVAPYFMAWEQEDEDECE